MKGFTLIELMIVVAIIAIIAAIAIPNLLESKKTANENAAIATMRSLTSAQEVYAAKWGQYGTTTQLGPKPTGQGLIDGHMATMTENAATAGTDMKKSGYYFAMKVAAAGASWCAIASPAGWGTTGERAFMIQADGTIKYAVLPAAMNTWVVTNYPKYLGE